MVTWFARAPVRAVVAWYALHTPQRARTTTERISMADIYIRIRARFLRLQHAGSSARMSLAALPCGGGCTGAHWAEGVAPRSHMSAPAPSEPARGRPQLTACWLLCGRSSPPPLCSPSRRRPWSRPRRRLGRTCRWRLSAPRPLHVLAASSLIAHPFCLLPAGSCLARGRRRAARPGTRWVSPRCARMAAPSTSGCARRRCEESCPVTHGASALRLCVCARPLADQARAGVHGGVGWLPRPGVRTPLQRLPVQDARDLIRVVERHGCSGCLGGGAGSRQGADYDGRWPDRGIL